MNAEEVQIVKDRLEADRGDSEYDHLTVKKVLHTLCMWQIWMYSLFFMGAAVAIYAYAYFTTVVLRGMGHSTERVFLLSAPPCITAIPYTFAVAYMSDCTKLRSPFVLLNAGVTITGLMMTAYHTNNDVRYGGIFLGIAGCNGNLPSLLAWQANNIRGQSTRAVASALQVAFGAIGGIYASTTFMQKEAPTYTSGLWAAVAAQLFTIVGVVGMVIYYKVQNRKADRLHVAVEGSERFRYTY